MRRRRRQSRAPAVLAVLLVAGLAGAGVYAWRTHPEWLRSIWSRPAVVAPGSLRPHPNTASRPQPVRPKTVRAKVYFLQVVNGEVRLTASSRTLPAAAPARLAVEALLTGAVPTGCLRPLPPGTKLRGITVQEGVARANFSRELVSEFHGGSESEEAAVYAIVNTLTSLPGVRKVQILVEGKPRDTLGGHLDLSIPLGADPEVLGGREAARR